MTTDRPRFLCHGCGGIVVAATRLVDATALELRHAASCPGEARLVIDPAVDPGRRSRGEQRVAEIAAQWETERQRRRLIERMPRHPSQAELDLIDGTDTSSA